MFPAIGSRVVVITPSLEEFPGTITDIWYSGFSQENVCFVKYDDDGSGQTIESSFFGNYKEGQFCVVPE